MTEKELRQKIVDTAISYLGCNEKDGSHRPIIDRYNAHKPLARGYKVKYTDAWCATFVSSMAIQCGLTGIIPTECGCSHMISWFKKLGAWQESDKYSPKPGDVLFYDWDDNGVGDNTGNPDHVGIVVKTENGTAKIIEGNFNDKVAYRSVPINGKYIRGYGVPKYATLASVEKTVTVTVPVLKRGDKGASVKSLQALLIGYGYSVGSSGVDGSFGPATDTAVRKYQKDHGITVDGSVGPVTWGKLLNA